MSVVHYRNRFMSVLSSYYCNHSTRQCMVSQVKKRRRQSNEWCTQRRGIVTTLPTKHQNNNHNGNGTVKIDRSTDMTDNSNSTTIAFDRNVKKLQRSGAARAQKKYSKSSSSNPTNPSTTDDVDYDYFHVEIANRLLDRLDDIVREDGFPLALNIGAGPGHIYRGICEEEALYGSGGRGGVRKLVQLESSSMLLYRDDDLDANNEEKEETDRTMTERCGTYQLVADEEGPLSFPSGTFDLVISSDALHYVNDLPGLFSEVKRILKPDGCFLFAMVGGSTLSELRSSFVLSELERDGGISTHCGPFVDHPDVGSLLSNAGFTLTTVDIDTISLGYPNAMVLMEHLQRMGDGNACRNRRKNISVDTFLSTACVYDEMFPLEQDYSQDGTEAATTSVEATVQVIYAIGWTPHESQPQPKKRGSAKAKIGENVFKE